MGSDAGSESLLFFEGLQARDPNIDGREVALESEVKLNHTTKDGMSQPLDFTAAALCTRLNFLDWWLSHFAI